MRRTIHNILILAFTGECMLLVWLLLGDPRILDALLASSMVMVSAGIIAALLTCNETRYDP